MKRIINYFESLNREAAIDSAKNVLAFIGVATVLGDFAAMRVLYAVPLAGVAFGAWLLDYERHF